MVPPYRITVLETVAPLEEVGTRFSKLTCELFFLASCCDTPLGPAMLDSWLRTVSSGLMAVYNVCPLRNSEENGRKTISPQR